jgi:hypothetical protein
MTEATANADATILRRTLIAVVVIAAVAAVVGSVLFGVRTGSSVLIGGLLGAGNLWAIARLVRGFLAEAGFKPSWTLLAMVKLAALFAVVLALVISGLAELLALAAGYAALPLGIVLGPILVPRRQDA